MRSLKDELPHVSELFEFEADTFGEPERYDALDEALQLPDLSDAEPHSPGPEIGGSRELQEALKELLNDYIHLLQAEVSKTPAKIPPMKLKVNDNQWGFAKTNTQRYRIQSSVKDAEIWRQVELMVQLGVVQKCNQNRHSQVHLVPKPNSKWRFCIDYRFLNDCTEMEGGVLPRIR